MTEDKPDFEKIANAIVSNWNYNTVDDVDSLKEGMEFVWNDFVLRLQKEIEELTIQIQVANTGNQILESQLSELRQAAIIQGNIATDRLNELYEENKRLKEENTRLNEALGNRILANWRNHPF